MLSDNDIKETLSRAYVTSVAASMGLSVEGIAMDRDSIDCVIRSRKKFSEDALVEKATLELQLKATSRQELVVEDNYIKFSLPMKNYNDLRATSLSPRLLVIYLMPQERVDWVRIDIEQIVLKKCAYWYSLKGHPDIQNTASTTIQIPMTQVFDATQLRELFIKAGKLEGIINGSINPEL